MKLKRFLQLVATAIMGLVLLYSVWASLERGEFILAKYEPPTRKHEPSTFYVAVTAFTIAGTFMITGSLWTMVREFILNRHTDHRDSS